MTIDRAGRSFRNGARGLVALAAVVLMAACQQVPREELASIDAPAGSTVSDDVNLARDYVLGHNDLIEVRVFGQENLTGEYRIDASGDIAMPLLGEVPAGGKTANELAQLITTRLRDGYLRDPQVTVQVMGYRPFFIVGGVQNPGSYDYVAGMTVLQAIAMAGGYSDDAIMDQPVVVTRGSTDDTRRGYGTPSTRVFPGDTIEVPVDTPHLFGPG